MTIRGNGPCGMQVDAGWMRACTKGVVKQDKRFVCNQETTGPPRAAKEEEGQEREGGKKAGKAR